MDFSQNWYQKNFQRMIEISFEGLQKIFNFTEYGECNSKIKSRMPILSLQLSSQTNHFCNNLRKIRFLFRTFPTSCFMWTAGRERLIKNLVFLKLQIFGWKFLENFEGVAYPKSLPRPSVVWNWNGCDRSIFWATYCKFLKNVYFLKILNWY